MIFTVVYLPSAQNELAELWNNGPDRAEISRAANLIDQLLRRDPISRSKPFDSQRIFVESPLAVSFAVSMDDCLVTVVQVNRFNN